MRRVLLMMALSGALAGCGGGGSGPGSLPPLDVAPTQGPAASSGGSAPVASPSATASASPGVSASPEPTREPLPGQAYTTDSAEAFARYWIATVNVASVSFDPTELKRISAPDCVTCNNYIGSFEKADREHERWVGGTYTVRQTVGLLEDDGVTAKVLLNRDSDKFQAYSADNKLLQASPARQNVAFQFELRWRSSAWVVCEVLRV